MAAVAFAAAVTQPARAVPVPCRATPAELLQLLTLPQSRRRRQQESTPPSGGRTCPVIKTANLQ